MEQLKKYPFHFPNATNLLLSMYTCLGNYMIPTETRPDLQIGKLRFIELAIIISYD